MRNFTSLILFAFLASCGGGDSSGGSVGAPPTPPPVTPTPPGPPPPAPQPPSLVTVSYLHVFGIATTDGQQPNGPLLQASDGNFYGTTRTGGAGRCKDLDNFCGAIFKITPSGTETVLRAFNGGPSDGEEPTAPLIQGRDGALYGLTVFGGAYGRGTAFKITLSGEYIIIHSFGASKLDGDRPQGGLVQGKDGNFYGATIGGGPNDCSKSGGDCGVAFKLTPDGTYTVLHSFGAPGDGAVPRGSLIQAPDGNFYGTTTSGGNLACSAFLNLSGCGTIFKMTPAGAVTVLHAFGASTADGMLPYGPLVLGDDGAYYGTTYGGGGGACPGSSVGCGTVFRVTPSGATTIIYAFSKSTSDGTTSYADGYNPTPHLIKGSDGNFYGQTESGGLTITALTGTIFRLTPSGVKTILFKFANQQEGPSYPDGGLIQAADGAFYGVTNYNGGFGSVGGRLGAGTAFKMTIP